MNAVARLVQALLAPASSRGPWTSRIRGRSLLAVVVALLAVGCTPTDTEGDGEGDGEGEGEGDGEGARQGAPCASSNDCAGGFACVRDFGPTPPPSRCLARCGDDGACDVGDCFDIANFGVALDADGAVSTTFFPVCAEPGAVGQLCRSGDPGDALFPDRACEAGLTCTVGCDVQNEDCERADSFCR